MDNILRKMGISTLKLKIKKFDDRYGLGALENFLFSNWFNPLATFWINFRSLKISQAVKFPIWAYGRPRFYNLSGDIVIKGKVSSGMIKFNQTRTGSPNAQTLQSGLLNVGTIIFHGRGVIGTGNHICVGSYRAVLEIGANFKITDMCNIGCFEKIVIGELSRITHRCQVLDSNYHYIADFNKHIVPNWHRPVHIGKGCWICNSSTVTGGAIIPDFTIVASNSLVNRNFSYMDFNSIIGGFPAKYIATGYRRVENLSLEKQINRFYFENTEEVYRLNENVTMEDCSNVFL